MCTPVSNQIAKRKAVAEALERRKVFIASRRFRGDGQPITRVLVFGRYYDVGDALLRQLLSGVTPRELELEPAPEEADPG